MAFNTVRINQNNLPQLCDHELFLHSISHCTLSAKAGGGFPGSGLDMTSDGAVYLTNARMIFVPHLSSQSFFSLSMPIAAMTKLNTNFSTPLTAPRDYTRFDDIHPSLQLYPPQLSSSTSSPHPLPHPCYKLHQGHSLNIGKSGITDSRHSISFTILPLNMGRVTILDSYQDLFTQTNRPIPTFANFTPNAAQQPINQKIMVKISLGNTGVCTLHCDTDSIPPIGSETDNNNNIFNFDSHPKNISCYHSDFLYSMIRSYDFIHYLLHYTHHDNIPERYIHNVHQFLPKLISEYKFETSHKFKSYPMLGLNQQELTGYHQTHLTDRGNDDQRQQQQQQQQQLTDTDYQLPPAYGSINTFQVETVYTPLIHQSNQHPSSQDTSSSSNDSYGGYGFGIYQPPSIIGQQQSSEPHQTSEPDQTQKSKKLVPLTNPYSPILTLIFLSLHMAQPIDLAGFIAHHIGIEPHQMYSEWGSMKIPQQD